MIDRCDIESQITESQQPCSSGIEFSSSNLKILGSTVRIQLSSHDTLLKSNENKIYIDDCPTGHIYYLHFVRQHFAVKIKMDVIIKTKHRIQHQHRFYAVLTVIRLPLSVVLDRVLRITTKTNILKHISFRE